MKIIGSALQLVVLAASCALVASCANAPSRQYTPAAQDAPPTTNQQASNGGRKPALTIQSGEGEQLNLPWFIRDVQDMVNGDTGSSTPWQSVN